MSEKLMNFTVDSRDGCAYCTKIQQVLQIAELRHVIYKLNRDFDKESFYQQFGQGSTFPQVVLNGDNFGGCTETVKYIQENKLV